jgi:hypothetical protein
VNKKFLGSFAAVGLLLAGTANAVPCGFFGVEPSAQCRDGTGIQDSVEIINAGGFFGVSNWQFLDRVDTHTDLSNQDFWRVVGAHRGLPAGSFALADGIWNTYSKLAVALKGGGAYPVGAPADTPAVNWSLYQLVPGQSLYDWVYGATRSGILRNLFTITLYGVAGGVTPTSVAEPGTIGLLLIGAAALMLVGRRRSEPVAA